MGTYHERHAKPGYWGDITRHFDTSVELIDVGCGVGWLADHFVNYSGLESHSLAVQGAQDRGRNVLLGDVSQPWPFDDGKFTGAVLKDVLEHVVDPAPVLGELRRVLRHGSVAWASAPDNQRWVWEDYTHRRPFPLKALRHLFDDNGFRVLEAGYETVIPGSGIVSDWTSSHRRPVLFQVAGRVRWLRRNTWVLAEAV